MATTGTALWPSATTWPDTTVYPGQGTVVFVRALVSFDDVSVASPTWTDKSLKLRLWSTSRGRGSELEKFDAGTVTIAFDNRDRALDPIVNTAVRPLNRIWLYAEFSGETHDLFTGYAESWQQTWPEPGTSDAIATVRGVDEFKLLSLSRLPGTTGTPGPDIAGDATFDLQLTRILDNAHGLNSPNRAPRQLQHTIWGEVLYRPMTGQVPKTELDETVDLESQDAALFVSASGTITFLTGTHRAASPYDTVQATFDDDGTDLPYLDLVTEYSDSFLFNEIVITNVTPATFTWSDATSISRYQKRTLSFTLASNRSGTDLHGAELLAKYKDPMTRATNLIPDMAEPAVAENVFRRELLDRIRVFRTPPGGGARFDQQLFIQKIELAGTDDTPGLISCRLGVSPL